MVRALLLALLLVVSLPEVARTAEAKCLTPPSGGTCICSEPLQATSYPSVALDHYNPNDSTSFECGQSAVAGAAISHLSGRPAPTASTNAVAMAALPSGHAVARFMTAGSGSTGQNVGHSNGIPSNIVRLATRWYVYHTSDFVMKGDTDVPGSSGGQCNSKWSEHWPPGPGGVDNRVDYTAGFHIYEFATWPNAISCCVSGPRFGGSITSPAMRGKWMLSEIVIGPVAGPNTRIQMFLRNITDNGPEVTEIDTNAESELIDMSPPQRVVAILQNNFRVDNGGSPCLGTAYFSHFMTMGWTTNAGQRIGAATEVEGTGQTPNNFNVLATQGTYGVTGAVAGLTQLAGPTQVGFVVRVVLPVVVVALLATLIVLRRRRHHADR